MLPGLFADVITILAVIFFSIALLKLYNAYGRPRSLLAMIAGINFFFISSIIDLLVVLYAIKWQAVLVIEGMAFTAGAVLTAGSMVIILNYLLSAVKIDPLTNVYNRLHFKEVLDAEVARSKRNNLQFTLLYCDIDNLKLINDTMGHKIGDVALQHIAQRLNDNVRASDVVARWGGDEFVILFPQTDIQTAQTMGDRLNEEIGSITLAGRQLSVSIGMAAFPDDGDSADRILSLADTRMYHHKDEKIGLKKPWDPDPGHGHLPL
jgi:diguanylate cyclase (GGDEF)-like protein